MFAKINMRDNRVATAASCRYTQDIYTQWYYRKKKLAVLLYILNNFINDETSLEKVYFKQACISRCFKRYFESQIKLHMNNRDNKSQNILESKNNY